MIETLLENFLKLDYFILNKTMTEMLLDITTYPQLKKPPKGKDPVLYQYTQYLEGDWGQVFSIINMLEDRIIILKKVVDLLVSLFYSIGSKAILT